MNGRLLTARQVADQLGLTAETVLRWTRRGDLPGIRLPGGAWRYRESDFDRWLVEREMGAASREVSATRDDRAHAEGYVGLESPVSATPPHTAATTERNS